MTKNTLLKDKPMFIITALTLIVAVIAIFVDTEPHTVVINNTAQANIEKPSLDQKRPFEENTNVDTIDIVSNQINKPITLQNFESKALLDIKTNISVTFNTVSGKEIAILTIAVGGKKAITLPIFNPGQSVNFKSNNGQHIVNVLSVNFDEKNIVISITREI